MIAAAADSSKDCWCLLMVTVRSARRRGSVNSARTSNHQARSSAGRDKTTITGRCR